MKTNQAKAIAGIKYNLTTRKDFADAEHHCVKLIVSARKEGNDARAAELSAAKSVFQKRARAITARNTCAVCGVTIARGATHCRIHQRNMKAMALPPASGSDQKIKDRITPRRKFKRPSDPLALLGYYATPVQKIVKRWRNKISDDIFKANIESLMIACVYSATRPATGKVDEIIERFSQFKKPFIFDLILAVENVFAKDSLSGLILKQGFSGDESDCMNEEPQLRTWEKLSAISKGRFSSNHIKVAAKRLKLTA